jgi:branched-chain amino acid transport system substrate-binding protein
MKRGQVRVRVWRRSGAGGPVTALLLVLALLLAACGGTEEEPEGDTGAPESETAEGAEGAEGAESLACGAGTGEQATGEPILLGGIATEQPGTDFSEIPRMAAAVFECVNDNGGINGRPIEYVIETEQTDPAQAAALAQKLIETDGVLGIVGNTSLIECSVNHEYYEEQGFYVIASGIAPECYSTPNIASVNMGPRYGIMGAAQYLIRAGAEKLVLTQANVPGTEYIDEGFQLVAEEAGIPTESFTDNVPIQDANSAALRIVQAAGEGGGVIANFTPPETLKILQAAQQLGLQDQVMWACGAPCNTDFLAEALGSEWNEKLGVNAELNLISAEGPHTEMYRAVQEQYAPDIPLGSFSQMGFVQALIMVEALMSVEGEYTVESVNEAIKNVDNFETDMLCKPWYFGEAPLHIPNNTDRTVTPEDGVMVELEDCFEISDVDPAIAQVRELEAAG